MNAVIERGYYDTPRRCTLTELADELDLAKSTCSERLHRAEENSRLMTPFDDETITTELSQRGFGVETHNGYGPDDHRTGFVAIL